MWIFLDKGRPLIWLIPFIYSVSPASGFSSVLSPPVFVSGFVGFVFVLVLFLFSVFVFSVFVLVLFFGFSSSLGFSSGFLCMSQTSSTLVPDVTFFPFTAFHKFSCSFGNTAPK